MSGEVGKIIQKGLSGNAEIQCSLHRPSRRALFVLLMGACAFLIGYPAVRIGAAAVWSSMGNRGDVHRAIALDPRNPAFYEQMGRLFQTSLDASPAESIPWFRKAVAIEPDSGLYWERLGTACELAGQRTCAAGSFSHALTLDPMDPQVLWRAANDDLYRGANEEAAASFRRLLEMDPKYATAVFAISLRAYANPAVVAGTILSRHSSAALKLTYANFLAQRNDFPQASQIWSETISERQTFDFSQADPYLERLIASGRIAQAVTVWNDLQRLAVLPEENGQGSGNLVFNPGFEGSPLNAGFGWRCPENSAINVAFGDSSGQQGTRSLRIDFLAPENHGVAAAYQLIAVSDGRRYRLSAWVRSAGTASTGGPRLRLSDPLQADCAAVETPGVAGTTAWHKVGVNFSTCSTTKLIRLSIWCPRESNFTGGTDGHFWVYDVTLKPQARSSTRSSHEGSSGSGNR